jgi:hypothetical protein
VVKLDTSDGREVARVQVDPNPGDSVLAADGRTLYVTHYDLLRWQKAVGTGDAAAADSHLIAVDTQTMRVGVRRPLCPAAHGVRVTPDGATLYATCGTDEIAIVDLRAPGLSLRRVPVPGARVVGTSAQRCPYALSIAPDGSVWVSSLGPSCGAMGRGGVDVFDPTGPDGGAFDKARSATFRGSPVFASFVGPPGGFRAFVPEQGRDGSGDLLHVFDGGRAGEPLNALRAIALEPDRCYQPHMMLVSDDGRRGHLVCEGDHIGPGDFLWLDLEQGSVLGSVPIGIFADGLALIPGG